MAKAYPKHMTITDEGKALYGIWRRVRHDTDKYCIFSDYPKFFNWAQDNFYTLGCRLLKHDKKQPFSPDNCFFVPSDYENQPLTAEMRRRANDWTRTVNVLRRAFDLEPFALIEESGVVIRDMR